MNWQAVATVDEVKPGKPKIVTVEGKEIGLFQVGDGYVAVLNFCPHAGAPICRGRVTGRLTCDEAGRLDYDPAALTLRCPWHHWEFDLTTGEPVVPMRQRLKLYSVRVDAGKVFIRL